MEKDGINPETADPFTAFNPKALNYKTMAGLLTYSPSGRLPVATERTVAIGCPKVIIRAYSSGTVRDLHPVPFSSISGGPGMLTIAVQR